MFPNMNAKKLGPLIYNVEHLIEAPLERMIFGKTRYSGNNWFFRCMCARIMWLYDILAYFNFSFDLKFGTWKNEDWKKFVKYHNSQLYFIGNCDVYKDMMILNSSEFDTSCYKSEKFRSYMIPEFIEPTQEKLKMWLFHYPDAGELRI